MFDSVSLPNVPASRYDTVANPQNNLVGDNTVSQDFPSQSVLYAPEALNIQQLPTEKEPLQQITKQPNNVQEQEKQSQEHETFRSMFITELQQVLNSPNIANKSEAEQYQLFETMSLSQKRGFWDKIEGLRGSVDSKDGLCTYFNRNRAELDEKVGTADDASKYTDPKTFEKFRKFFGLQLFQILQVPETPQQTDCQLCQLFDNLSKHEKHGFWNRVGENIGLTSSQCRHLYSNYLKRGRVLRAQEAAEQQVIQTVVIEPKSIPQDYEKTKPLFRNAFTAQLFSVLKDSSIVALSDLELCEMYDTLSLSQKHGFWNGVGSMSNMTNSQCKNMYNNRFKKYVLLEQKQRKTEVENWQEKPKPVINFAQFQLAFQNSLRDCAGCSLEAKSDLEQIQLFEQLSTSQQTSVWNSVSERVDMKDQKLCVAYYDQLYKPLFLRVVKVSTAQFAENQTPPKRQTEEIPPTSDGDTQSDEESSDAFNNGEKLDYRSEELKQKFKQEFIKHLSAVTHNPGALGQSERKQCDLYNELPQQLKRGFWLHVSSKIPLTNKQCRNYYNNYYKKRFAVQNDAQKEQELAVAPNEHIEAPVPDVQSEVAKTVLESLPQSTADTIVPPAQPTERSAEEEKKTFKAAFSQLLSKILGRDFQGDCSDLLMCTTFDTLKLSLKHGFWNKMGRLVNKSNSQSKAYYYTCFKQQAIQLHKIERRQKAHKVLPDIQQIEPPTDVVLKQPDEVAIPEAQQAEVKAEDPIPQVQNEETKLQTFLTAFSEQIAAILCDSSILQIPVQERFAVFDRMSLQLKRCFWNHVGKRLGTEGKHAKNYYYTLKSSQKFRAEQTQILPAVPKSPPHLLIPPKIPQLPPPTEQVQLPQQLQLVLKPEELPDQPAKSSKQEQFLAKHLATFESAFSLELALLLNDPEIRSKPATDRCAMFDCQSHKAKNNFWNRVGERLKLTGRNSREHYRHFRTWAFSSNPASQKAPDSADFATQQPLVKVQKEDILVHSSGKQFRFEFETRILQENATQTDFSKKKAVLEKPLLSDESAKTDIEKKEKQTEFPEIDMEDQKTQDFMKALEKLASQLQSEQTSTRTDPEEPRQQKGLNCMLAKDFFF